MNIPQEFKKNIVWSSMSETSVYIYVEPTSTMAQGSSKYRWLSIESYHSFIIDQTVWPSVFHYISAKQFEGTLFEEDIRRCKSISMVKGLLKPRYVIEDSTNKVLVYGKHKNYRARSDWDLVSMSHLEDATRAKFIQNPSLITKLLQTVGMKIVDKYVKGNGVCLEKIRAELGRPVEQKMVGIDEVYTYLKGMTIPEPQINVLLDMFRYIRKLEGCKRYYGEMMEDVIENIVPKRVREIVKIVNTLSKGWNDIPGYVEDMVGQLKDRVIMVCSNSIDIEHAFRVSLLLLCFLAVTKGGIAFPVKEDIKLPPHPRSYRNGLPMRVQKTIARTTMGTTMSTTLVRGQGSSVSVSSPTKVAIPIDKSVNEFHDW